MKIEEHLRALKESVEEIEDAISKGSEKRQRTIGFHTSAGAVDMIEIILHKRKLIDPGFIVKHEWFNSDRKIKEKISFEFPAKSRIINLIKSIEKERNKLCYGRAKTQSILSEVILNFFKLKEIFEEGEYNEL
ncbi:MAG: hypothetical protein AABX39_01390 [Nanoarchaeota archaeon]